MMAPSNTVLADGPTAPTRRVEIEGHRGARGLLPENTIPSFLKAAWLGVDTLELDVVISRDKQVVVSHDLYFSAVISTDPAGNPVTAANQKDHILYAMDYAEIQRYDVGSRGNVEFPEQQKLKVSKPLLKDVFAALKNFEKTHNKSPFRFNIEIKSKPANDDKLTPKPAEFARLVYDTIHAAGMENHVIVQSFDPRPLQELRRMDAKLSLALLSSQGDFESDMALLGFQPEAYSPNYNFVTAATVKYCRAKKIKLVVWTPNEVQEMRELVALGVDGIITDYPNRAIQLLR